MGKWWRKCHQSKRRPKHGGMVLQVRASPSPGDRSREHSRLGSQLPGVVLERQVVALERWEPLACCGQRDSACPVLKALVPAALSW